MGVKKNRNAVNSSKMSHLSEEGRTIIAAIEEIKQQLEDSKSRFDAATDDALIECYIYEMTALHKKYEYYLKIAKEMGLVKDMFYKIS
jgi:hypothetical protein